MKSLVLMFAIVCGLTCCAIAPTVACETQAFSGLCHAQQVHYAPQFQQVHYAPVQQFAVRPVRRPRVLFAQQHVAQQQFVQYAPQQQFVQQQPQVVVLQQRQQGFGGGLFGVTNNILGTAVQFRLIDRLFD